MQLFDRTNVDQLSWPDTEEARQARALLVPMMHKGVTEYIRNVKTDLYLLAFDHMVLPVTVNDREYHNSYLTSNYFPLNYLEERFEKKWQSSFLKALHAIGLQMVGGLLKAMKINKIVIVNNWLLTTNLYPTLVEEHVSRITDFLRQRFPDHLIIFRSVNAQRCSGLVSELRANHYRVVGSRYVYMYDPQKKKTLSSKVLYHHRKDRSLIAAEGYEVVRGEQITSEELARVLALYRCIYVTRYTQYSPQYTDTFVREAVRHRILELVGLKKGGLLCGVLGCYERNQSLIIPFFGYDAQEGVSNHLYRMLMMLGIDEAERRGVVLDDGSGASAPKKYRGMKPVAEYVAFYDSHLPRYRRLFWGIAELAMNRFAFPALTRKLQKAGESG